MEGVLMKGEFGEPWEATDQFEEPCLQEDDGFCFAFARYQDQLYKLERAALCMNFCNGAPNSALTPDGWERMVEVLRDILIEYDRWPYDDYPHISVEKINKVRMLLAETGQPPERSEIEG